MSEILTGNDALDEIYKRNMGAANVDKEQDVYMTNFLLNLVLKIWFELSVV
jgi:hypothetical protein